MFDPPSASRSRTDASGHGRGSGSRGGYGGAKPKRFLWPLERDAPRERKWSVRPPSYREGRDYSRDHLFRPPSTRDHYRLGRYDLVTATLHDKGYNVQADVVASHNVYRGIDAELEA